VKLARRADARNAATKVASATEVTPLSADEARLADDLLARGLITSQQHAAAHETRATQSGLRLGQVLVRQGALGEAELAQAFAALFAVSMIDLRSVTPQQEALDLLPEPTAVELGAVPLVVDDQQLQVAVYDPGVATVERLSQVTGRQVVLAVARESEVRRVIGLGYRALAGVHSRVKSYEAQDVLRREAAELRIEAVGADAPVVEVVQMIITQALRDRASDVHIEPHGDRLRVRYRIDGALNDVLDLPGSMAGHVASRVKILGDMNIVERRRPQDGQISTEIEGRPVDIRVATAPTIGGEKVVLRLLDKSRPLYKLAELGMPEQTIARYSTLLRAPYGMVICAGPTGSGKTTTLYGSLGAINSPDRNIMTIEDPVEYTFDSINQMQINVQAGVTFASGLRSILRQDPDVILVGEVRDVDTARIAVQSALTGHFVLSSLHATDAVAALHRLLDMGIETFLVASSITGVIAQRLVRRICTYCVEPYEPNPEERAFLAALGGHDPAGGFRHGVGCNFCAKTGFLDRVGVYELLAVTDEIRELVLTRAAHDDVRKTAQAEGMSTLQEEALRLVDGGITTVAEVMRSIYLVGG
jgi:type IV pilus assembly protein PilB